MCRWRSARGWATPGSMVPRSYSHGRPLHNSVIPAKAGIQRRFAARDYMMSIHFAPIPTFLFKKEGVSQRSPWVVPSSLAKRSYSRYHPPQLTLLGTAPYNARESRVSPNGKAWPGPIAQWLELLPHKEKVPGSNPGGPTCLRERWSVGRAGIRMCRLAAANVPLAYARAPVVGSPHRYRSLLTLCKQGHLPVTGGGRKPAPCPGLQYRSIHAIGPIQGERGARAGSPEFLPIRRGKDCGNMAP